MTKTQTGNHLVASTRDARTPASVFVHSVARHRYLINEWYKVQMALLKAKQNGDVTMIRSWETQLARIDAELGKKRTDSWEITKTKPRQ